MFEKKVKYSNGNNNGVNGSSLTSGAANLESVDGRSIFDGQ